MKRQITFFGFCLFAIALPMAYATAQDVFDKHNQAKTDPFGEWNKAGAVKISPPTVTSQPEVEKHAPKAPPEKITSIHDLIDFYVTVSPREIRPGQTAQVTITGVPRVDCYTYSITKKGPEQRPPALAVLKVGAWPSFQPLAPIQESPDPVFDSFMGFFEHKQPFTWKFDVLANSDAKVGPVELPFTIATQACKDGCVQGEIALKATFAVAGEPVNTADAIKLRASQKFPPTAVTVGESKKPADSVSAPPAAGTVPREYADSIQRVRDQILAVDPRPNEGLVLFMLNGMFWGFVSLITPCVFPMIPITVSFFLKQSEKEHHRPVTMALVYCGTIVIVLTIAAAALLNFFRFLSINPLMNFALGLLFVFFALSLFGMYEIELPSFLARYTSERESKGGLVGTIFMALTFTIISFACVAPFLGGFGGTASTATRPFWHTILGGLAFSVTFAAPFFILALFPTLLKAMPKSGSWLNSVKVIMGFLELAAALKFFRAGELVLPSPWGLFTFDLVLGLWIAISFLCGLYLLAVYRLPHDSPVEHLSVPRLLFAFMFIGFGFYLMPALFSSQGESEQARPSGKVYAWVNSFLLPDASTRTGTDAWSANLESAITQARFFREQTGKSKLVFIDFTGEVCTNCSLNERDIFTKAEIQKLFKHYALVKLYCDTIPLKYYAPEDRAAAEAGRRSTDAMINYALQAEVFDGVELPLYVILEPLPDGKIAVVAKYTKGLIRSEAEFAEFLRSPQQAIGAAVASR